MPSTRAPCGTLGALPSEGRAGFGGMERGWRQHPNEVITFARERMEQGCEGEDYILLRSGSSGRGWGLTFKICNSDAEGLEHPTGQLGLYLGHLGATAAS